MWWAGHAEKCGQVIQDRWRANLGNMGKHLIHGRGVHLRSGANADGDPAADGIGFPKQLVAAMWRT
jgi:hypothetical protein